MFRRIHPRSYTGWPNQDADGPDIIGEWQALGRRQLHRIVQLRPRDQVTETSAPEVWATLLSPPRRSLLLDMLVKIAEEKQHNVVLSVISTPIHDPIVSVSAPFQADAPLILVVDDVDINRIVAERLLKRLGYRSMSAEGGLMALDILERTLCDAVLMDCRMPDMDGFSTTIEIRRREANRRHTPIISFPANVRSSDRDDCLNAGMDDYLSKPVELATMSRVLARWAPHTITMDAPGRCPT